MTEPTEGVEIHSSVGIAYQTKAEVVGPTIQFAVDGGHLLFHIPGPPAASHLADLPAKPDDLLLRRTCANVGTPRLRRVTAADGVAQEVKRFIRHSAELRLGFALPWPVRGFLRGQCRFVDQSGFSEAQQKGAAV